MLRPKYYAGVDEDWRQQSEADDARTDQQKNSHER